MDLDQVKELMSRLEESTLSKLVYKKGDVELQLEKETSHPPHHEQPHHREHPHPHDHQHPPREHPASKAGGKDDSNAVFVKSPMVGTFYLSPAPDQPNFVKVGDKVSEDTIICIVEAMKVLNEVKAGVSGTVAEVLVENSQPVEFGTRLFRIS